MKFILIFLLTMTAYASDFIPGAYYIHSTKTNAVYVDVNQTTTTTNALLTGHTYFSADGVFELNTTEQSTVLQFSSGLTIQALPGSTFGVDSFTQTVADIDATPEILKVKDYILSVSLMYGAAHIVAPKYDSVNTMCVLQTPLMNLELNDGTYHIKSSPKFTAVYVLSGKIGVFDNQTNVKITKPAGTMIMIFPSPMRSSDTLVTEKPIELAEKTKLLTEAAALKSVYSDVMFSLIDGKIIGIKSN